METCKLQAGALIASAFFFTLPMGLSVNSVEAAGTATVGGTGAVTDQAAASKTRPEDFICRGITIGVTQAEAEKVFGTSTFEKNVRIQGVLVKVCDYADDFKVGYSVRTGKVVDIVIKNQKYTARNGVRYGATSAWLQQTYGKSKREMIDGSLFYIYANPANEHQHLMLETDSTDGHLTVMRITGLPLTDAEVDAMSASEPDLFGEAELRTIEIGEKDIDTSSLPATKQVKLGGLTK